MNKLKYLDGLRGVAAFIVVLHHFAAAFYPATYLGEDVVRHTPWDILFLKTPLGIFTAGNFAVMVFFILSGYVLSEKYFRTGDVKVLTSGAVRRYFRLLPPVLFSMGLAWVLMSLGAMPVKEAAELTGSQRWLAKSWDFAPNLWTLVSEGFYGVFFAFQANYNNVLWTMSWEFYGSFLVFGTAALVGPASWRRWALGVLIILLHRSYFVGFIIGMLLAEVMVTKPDFFKIFARPWIAALLMVIGLFLGSYPTFVQHHTTIYWFLWTDFFGHPPTFWHLVGALLVMLAVLASPGLQKFFSGRIPHFLGKISFSMYALHVVIIGSFSCAVFLMLHPHMDYNSAAGLTFAATLPLVLFSGWLTDKFIDQPGVTLSQKIQKKFFPL